MSRYFNSDDEAKSCADTGTKESSMRDGSSLDSSRPTHDPVESPAHYRVGKTEAIQIVKDVLMATYGETGWLAFCHGSALQYILRAGRKDAIDQDFGKAIKYLEWGKK